MFVYEDVLASAQENGNYTALIIQVLESQLNTVVVGNSMLDAPYPKIAVQVNYTVDLKSHNSLHSFCPYLLL